MKADTQFSEPRVRFFEERSKVEEVENYLHFCVDGDTMETGFHTIMSVNQLSIYGAVSDLCGEYSSRQTRTARLVVAEQSDPHFAPADHGLNKLVTNLNDNTEYDDNEQETSEMQFEDYALKSNPGDFASRSKAKAKNHKDAILQAHPQKLFLLGKELGPILNHKIIRPPIIQCRRNWSIFFVMVIYLKKKMERSNSGD